MKRASTHRGRFYDENGVKYPSVTTILSVLAKPALVVWSANVEREMVIGQAAQLYNELIVADRNGSPAPSSMAFMTQLAIKLGKQKAHQKLLEKAGDIGSQAHAMIEWMLRTELCQEVGPSPTIGPEAQMAVDAWKEWRSAVKFKPLLVETGVVSKVHGYAGTLDVLSAEIDGIETLCDWKTGKRIYYEAHLQNAAYRVAAREMGICDPKAGLLLRLPKSKEDPGFEAVPARDEQECFAHFLAAKQLWKDMQSQDKWMKEQDEKAAAA